MECWKSYGAEKVTPEFHSLNRKMFKKQAGAGEAGFGFLEFGDVNWRDVETLSFETGTCAREGSRENDGAAEGECIRGVGLSGIDVDPVVGGKRDGDRK